MSHPWDVVWVPKCGRRRYQVSARLLRGLHYYKLLQQPEALPAARDTPRGGTARARRIEARRLTPQPDVGSGLEQLARLNLTAAGIASDDHYSDFNTMVGSACDNRLFLTWHGQGYTQCLGLKSSAHI